VGGAQPVEAKDAPTLFRWQTRHCNVSPGWNQPWHFEHRSSFEIRRTWLEELNTRCSARLILAMGSSTWHQVLGTRYFVRRT